MQEVDGTLGKGKRTGHTRTTAAVGATPGCN